MTAYARAALRARGSREPETANTIPRALPGERRTYAITPDRLEAVHAWLREPSLENPELRDLGLLKLFFTELADDETFQSLVLEQAALHRSMLERYEWLGRRYGNRPEYAHRVLRCRLVCT